MATTGGAADGGDLDRVLRVLAFQEAACQGSASPLYTRILQAVAADARGGGVCARVLAGRPEEPFGSALALRFLAAVHRVVLDGRAPELAAFYPSVGGSNDGDPGPAFMTTVQRHRAEVTRRTDDPVQTNEVGRSAVLVGGYAEVARRTLLPLRVLEVGASAGLNLRWDQYAYVTAAGVSGDPVSPVRFEGVWDGAEPDLPPTFDIAERIGCDRQPIDATTADGRLALMSFVWPDQLDRLARLVAAVEVARRVPAVVERAGAGDWVAARLAVPARGVATVVVHSIVMQYLPSDERERVVATVRRAGRRASWQAPVSWLRMEPAGERAELRLTTWPSGEDRVLATAGYHGQPIWWAPSS